MDLAQHQATKTKFEEIKEKSDKYLLGLFKRYDVAFTYGVGELLFDTENRQYIDFMSGIAVTNLGHGEADIIDIIREQADRVLHTSNYYYSEEGARLAEALVNYSFPGKVFFCNSGTEANEAAFKLARKFGLDKGKKESLILALNKSFHGRTAASLSMTGQDKLKAGLGELVPGFIFIDPNDDDALEKVFKEYQGRIAGFIMEPILGESGIIPITDSFARLARKLTKENEALLIFDEIQTGMGRTGKLFCYEYFGFTPDVMTLAKGLGSGFPIGAMVVGQKYTEVLTPGMHGSTFGGNHLATAVAYETVRVMMTRDIVKNVAAISDYLLIQLKGIQARNPIVKEVRGRGLHIGVDFTKPTREIALECLKNGLIVNSTADTVIRFMPPLNISLERISEAMEIFEKVLVKFK